MKITKAVRRSEISVESRQLAAASDSSMPSHEEALRLMQSFMRISRPDARDAVIRLVSRLSLQGEMLH